MSEPKSTSFDDPVQFYCRQSRYSDPGRHADTMLRWPENLSGLMATIQNLLIYDVVAKPFYNVDLDDKRQADIHLRRVEDILDRALQVKAGSLTEGRPPEDRIAARCNNFGLVLLGALRQRGIPARAKVGFATYFKPGHYEDHWIVEYRDHESATWRYADPQFDEVWRERLQIDHDISNVPKDRFLTSGEVWRRCRAGNIDPTSVGIAHADMYGLFFVAGSLVREMAALNKDELLPWDVWGAQPEPFHDLSHDQLAYFDKLAEILTESDGHFNTVRARYRSDAALKVPDVVFNALLQQHQSLESSVDDHGR